MNPGKVFDIVAIACFAISAVPWWPAQPPYYIYNLIALGLVFFTLAHMVP